MIVSFPLLSLPMLWVFAVIPVGPAAFALGAVGGLSLQARAGKSPSMKSVVIQAILLGLILGGVVPLFCLAFGWAPTEDVISALPLAAATGVLCALVVLWLLNRARLLQLHGDPPLPS